MIDVLAAFKFIPFLNKSAQIRRKDGILILTDDNFKMAVDENEPLLVKFYLPWCERCRRFASEFVKVGELLKHSPIQLAQVDAETEKTLVQKHRVSVLPALKLFRNGTYVSYFGLQKAENIAAWAKKVCEEK